MSKNTLAYALTTIINNERVGKSECTLKPNSKVITKILEILKKNQFIDSFKIIEDGKSGLVTVKLNGNINKCGAITPRFSTKNDNYEKFEKRFLPAQDFGIIIVSTSKGLMTHKEAIEKKLGGRLIAYCY